MSSSKPVLGYWGIRGLAEPIRLLLHYCKVDFEDKQYKCFPKPDGGFDVSDWFNVKHSLGLPFPNLPYIIDGDVKLTQSDAVIRHVARKHNLLASTPEQMACVDMLMDVAKDINSAVTNICYSEKYEQMRPEFVSKKMPGWLKELSEYLGSKEWFTGELTVADFVLYERLAVLYKFESSCFEPHANLKQFMDRFAALPGVKEYLKSDAHKALKCNNLMASWQG